VRVLLLKFLRVEEMGLLVDVVGAIMRDLSARLVTVPVPESLLRRVVGTIGERVEVLPYKSGLSALFGLLREVRRRRFDAVVVAYDGSRWGHLKLEVMALLSRARKVGWALKGRVGLEPRIKMIARVMAKALLLPLFSAAGVFWGFFLLPCLLAADLVGRMGPKKKSPSIPPPEPEGISVVIPSRNGAKLLERNLPKLRRSLEAWGGRWEVIVADDASKDGTIKMLRRHFPWVKVVPSREWRGFGPTCNAGIKEAKFPLILLVNNDVEVEEDFLGPLVGRLISDPSVFAVGAMFRATRESLSEIPSVQMENLGAPAGCGLFDARKLRYLGGFDPIFAPFYWEENDLGIRAWRRGWRCIFDGRSKVVHPMGTSIRKKHVPGLVQRIFLRNKFLFTWKNLTSLKLAMLHILLLPSRLVQDVTILPGPYWSSALLQALLRLPAVLARRVKERREEVVPLSRLERLFRVPFPFYFV